MTDLQFAALATIGFLLLSYGCAVLFGKFAKAGKGDPVEGIEEERL